MDVENIISIEELEKNINILKEKISQQCEKSDRDPSEIKILYVIKNQSIGTILNLLQLGVKHLGENRLQELEKHQKELNAKDINIENLEWNFIGRIQKNKLGKIIQRSQVIQSVDKISTLQYISQPELKPKLYIQISVDEDSGRGGVSFIDAEKLLRSASDLGLTVEGVMLVPPVEQNPKICFEMLKEFADIHGISEISMGMTNDYKHAIECGTSLIRIGSGVFKGIKDVL